MLATLHFSLNIIFRLDMQLIKTNLNNILMEIYLIIYNNILMEIYLILDKCNPEHCYTVLNQKTAGRLTLYIPWWAKQTQLLYLNTFCLYISSFFRLTKYSQTIYFSFYLSLPLFIYLHYLMSVYKIILHNSRVISIVEVLKRWRKQD